MRIVSFIIAVLLILTGGGCTVMWLWEGPASRNSELYLLLLGFGIIPLVGGALLLRYAWKDRGGGPQ